MHEVWIYFILDILVILQPVRYIPTSEVPAEEEARAVPMKWAQGDRTAVQIDMSSLNPESNTFEVMTLYKFLVTLEKQKRVTSYAISYTECARAVESGNDTFKVELKTPHGYKTLPEPWLCQPRCCENLRFEF